jgi:hypothetical protein
MDAHSEPTRLTRGRLLKTGAVAALLAGTGGAGRALAGGGRSDITDAPGIGMPSGGAASLHLATYEPLVGTEFKLTRPDSRKLRMKLVAATKGPGPGESFSLLFRGRRTTGVDGGIYRLEHPRMGSFELFLSPVGRGVKGLNLEAVINRIAT